MMFEEDYLNFFKELAANNHKDWFDANRKRYEKSVKKPFQLFVKELIEAAKQVDQEIEIEPKDAIFRINRDIRFSKDKTPYKTHMAAIVSPGGRKNREVPGIYVHSSPEDFRLYSGLYEISRNNLEDLRYYIAGNQEEFNSIISNPEFVKTFGEIQGEKAKRIPAELKEAAEKQPLIYKQITLFFHCITGGNHTQRRPA